VRLGLGPGVLRATCASEGSDPLAEAYKAASEVLRGGLSSVMVDAEYATNGLGFGSELARPMGARYMTLAELSTGALAVAVRGATDR
jgi:Mg-chelatase subunit ChlD